MTSAMIVLTGPRKGQREFPQERLPQAHHLEKQFVHPRLSWDRGTALLRTLFPEETGDGAAAGWYELLWATHWPGRVTPGNGPFYVPSWALDEISDAKARRAVRAQLQKAGFREKTVHAVWLPHSALYLRAAMRAAGTLAWNVDPVLYRCYLYPHLGTVYRKKLRPYNTPRWRERPAAGATGPAPLPDLPTAGRGGQEARGDRERDQARAGRGRAMTPQGAPQGARVEA